MAATALMAIAGFSTVTMTSCSKDDKICATGLEGKNCDIEVRNSYLNTYRGTGSDNMGGTYQNWALRFSKIGTDPTAMQVQLMNSNDQNFLLLDVNLTSNTTYNIVPKTSGDQSYRGNGNINATTASMTLIEDDMESGTRVTTTFTFNNMNKQ